MTRPGDHNQPPSGQIGLFVLLVVLLAAIAIGAAWSFHDYSSRDTIPHYWWRVTAIALLTAVVLKLFTTYREPTEHSEDEGSADKEIGIGGLAREMALLSYGGALAWKFAGGPARSLSMPMALFTAVGLAYTIWRTHEFLEGLEHRRYRTAGSPAEWGWLFLAIVGLAGSGNYGVDYLTAGISAAIAVPYTLFLRHREAEALALLPPEPATALSHPEMEPDVDADDASATDEPWDGIPPIRPLL